MRIEFTKNSTPHSSFELFFDQETVRMDAFSYIIHLITSNDTAFYPDTQGQPVFSKSAMIPDGTRVKENRKKNSVLITIGQENLADGANFMRWITQEIAKFDLNPERIEVDNWESNYDAIIHFPKINTTVIDLQQRYNWGEFLPMGDGYYGIGNDMDIEHITDHFSLDPKAP